VKASAHKCDLCSGREGGPACVQNCPAQALQLATEATFPRWPTAAPAYGADGCAAVACASGDMALPEAGAKVSQMAATPPRGEADKRAAAVRKRDFAEIYQPFNAGQAQQAGALPAVRRTQYLRMDLPAA
jgi:hypothetical protein